MGIPDGYGVVRTRLPWHYFFRCWALGSLFPYLAPYLKEISGFSDREVGLLFMVGPIVGLVAQSLWSVLADRTGRHASIAALLCTLAALTSLFIPLRSTFFYALSLLGAHALFSCAIGPLTNAVTFAWLGDTGRSRFSHIRVFGTLGFLVSVLFVGRLFDRIGLHWVFVLYGGGMVAAAFMIRPMRAEVADAPGAAVAAARHRLARRRDVLFFLAAVMVAALGSGMASVFFSVYAKQLGATNNGVGQLWAVAAVAEIVMMLGVGRIARRMGLKPLMLLGTFGLLLRWTAAAYVTAWWQLFPVQLLHAFTFGALFVGAVTFVDRISPPFFRARAQTLYAMLTLHVCKIVAGPLSGEICERYGYQTLFRIAGLLGGLAFLIVLFFVREPEDPARGSAHR